MPLLIEASLCGGAQGRFAGRHHLPKPVRPYQAGRGVQSVLRVVGFVFLTETSGPSANGV